MAAPGVDLWVPAVGGDYRMTSGTSFSAAEVSGVIAFASGVYALFYTGFDPVVIGLDMDKKRAGDN